jgi:hypothetical protein
MPPIKNITMAFPCREKLGRGLSCDKCAHTIVDFRGKADVDLEAELSRASRPVCGLFDRTQMSGKFLKYAAASFMAASLTLPAKAQEGKQIDIAPTVCEEEIEEPLFIGMIVETAATPVGGMEKFYEAINADLTYPEEFTGRGRVFVEFDIDTLGKITDIKVVRGLNEWTDKEAVRVLYTINYPFVPARQRGKAVRMRMVLPIEFFKK